MAMENDFQYLFKVVLIGDSGVGKSNLMTRYTADEFTIESPSTIGVEFMTKSMKVENRDVKVQIWDTAGQERFRAISRSIYHGAKGAMLVYDITNQASFDNVSTWLQELRSHVQPSAVVMLIGNKCDLEHLRTVQKEQASKFAAENQLVLLETSALDSTNVDKAFEWLVKEVYNVVNSTGGVANTGKAQMATGKTVSINQPSRQAENPKRSCCK
ncbi:GTP-binding protein ypt3 [Diplonema papillatum]|nr:GTP-binding protein ypt3 [Diplonema papillatum]